MLCPRCDRELEQKRVKGPSTQVDACPGCKGVWLDEGELAEILGPRAVKPLPIPPDAREASLPCPRCRVAMVLFSYPGTLTVIDVCRTCRGVWLDAGEMKEIHTARTRGGMTCPKCGKVQPKADVCVGCGVVVRKALESSTKRPSREPRHDTPPSSEPPAHGIKDNLLGFIDRAISTLWGGIVRSD